MDNILEYISNSFKALKHVNAVVLAGSTQNAVHDKTSDYDIYVYSTKPISLDFREKLALNFSDEYEINNQFWEDGDEWVVENTRNIDIMYRDINMPEGNINWVLKNCNASVGFTTCILYNIQKSKILFDRNNWFENIQKQVNLPYPEALRKAIVKKNYPILSKNISSYKTQIEKAIKRNDIVNLNNRTSAFLASYFDIIFAINNQFHPGEKRLIELAKTTCTLLPANFEQNINALLLNNNNKIENISKIISELEKILLLQDTV